MKAYERFLLIYYFNGTFPIFCPLIVSKKVNLTVETSKLSFKFRIMRKLTFISVFLPFFVNYKLYAITFYAKFFDLNGGHSVILRVFFYKKVKKNLLMYSDKHF